MSATEDLDYWSFVELASRRLSARVGDHDAAATRVLLSLNRASDVVTYDLEAAIHRPRGRSWSAYRLVFVVWLAGPIEPKTAALLTGMSRAAVSNLAKPLVDDGVLLRTPDPEDGRSVRLELSDAGREAIEETFRAQNEREAAWVDVLTPDEQETLVGLLNKLVTARDFGVRDRR
ncbi:MarR family winged helix-turn-helix transcriptional regulator [Aeromicrobium massiliense]|uniref:MarR family winged helix-turn-helix transcriptional regulator n=1 Tax=Aeromicrobium massiliense TaxID=1464554 RepID=UPI0002D609D5|nr:MarR family transcriptional regulator [Aeromicrobium massiliense]